MAKNMVIVESPSKASTIKKYLGKNYDVIASVGHIVDLPKSSLGIDVKNRFEPKYIVIRGKGDLVKSIKKSAKACDKVYLATDPDREGEAISWHLANLLEIPEGEKCRVTFNEITKNAVKTAMGEPRVIDKDLVDAQQARRVLDRIVGYKISPLLWKKVKKGLSAGRVQSVAVRLLCDRENEINAFIPEEYWSVDAHLLQSKKSFVAKYYGKNGKKFVPSCKEDADRILSDLEGAEFTVTDVKKGKREKTPAPPFTTSTMQQEAGRKLGFTTQKTMSVAQQLYEGVKLDNGGVSGLITYMRTDSLRISEDVQALARNIIADTYGKEYITPSPRKYKTKKNIQDAHEAIRPTMPELAPSKVKEYLAPDQYKLYKLIWERFMASQMSDAIYDTVTATVDASSHTFKATGSTVKFPGFTVLYIEGTDGEKEKEASLPELCAGDKPTLKELKSEQHFTQPPSRYTEASLVKALEEKGIGRPSTYSPTIATIITRGYCVRDKKLLVPTELGMIVTDLMKEHFADIVNEKFTANMESKLDDIEIGKHKWFDVLEEFYPKFSEDLKTAEGKIGNIELKDEVSDVVCEKCGRLMVYKHGRFGKFLACPGYPECRNAKAIVKGTGVKCPDCGGDVIEKKSKRGKVFFGCSNYPKCSFTSWDKPLDEKCDVCGGVMYQKIGRFSRKYCPVCDAKSTDTTKK